MYDMECQPPVFAPNPGRTPQTWLCLKVYTAFANPERTAMHSNCNLSCYSVWAKLDCCFVKIDCYVLDCC